MNNIVLKFFELIESDQIEINWSKSNISFSLINGRKTMNTLLQEINKSNQNQDKEIEEKDIVESFFAIMSNRVNNYYNENILTNKEDIKITKYIEDSIRAEVLENINKEIFLDNSILNNRFQDINYEVLTKRDSNKINKINGHTVRIIIEKMNTSQGETSFEIELKLNELKKIIKILTKAEENLKTLIN